MADFKGQKKGRSHVQNTGIFLVAQDVVLSHRAKFQLIINFFQVKAISTGLDHAAEVTNDTWQKVVQNFCICAKACFKKNGCHIEHVDYKKYL